jgi:uncharacterized protein (DUF1778 family)
METTAKDRIDLRISKNQKEILKYASELRGFKNLSEFIVSCANTEAKKIISEDNNILQTFEDKKIFIDAILNPPAPNRRLKDAMKNYNVK